ncbi:ethanolamine kinase [Metarhizium guizhouense ARSEF 977]|uniref:ethanolamine kinase n=1 Tax=Metarhizium guizhouense (strain ARSEF 977) TaxID=1276136 RepID=A0A0B4GIA4_METGA|nr:ethanolamine kinase [Metarhizium guizhouense ARSEF 977]
MPCEQDRNEDGKRKSDVPRLALQYSHKDPEELALRLLRAIGHEWNDNQIRIVPVTGGINNTLIKLVHKRNDLAGEGIHEGPILLKAYGVGTDILIDREPETENHELLMRFNLAPQLLARFDNGMLYNFIKGRPARPEDLRKPAVYLAVAGLIAEWHARIPCFASPRVVAHDAGGSATESKQTKPSTSLWAVLQKWIAALPVGAELQRARRAQLQAELDRLVQQLDQRSEHGP